MNLLPLTAQILIAHGDLAIPLDLHKDRKEAEARVPYHNLLFATPGDLRIHQWPRELPWKLQENQAHSGADLGGDNSPAVSGLDPPMRQRVGQILHQRFYVGGSGIRNAHGNLPQPWVAQLQHSLYGHLSRSPRSCFSVSAISVLNLLRSFPLSRLGRAENRLNDRHIGQGILERDRHVTLAAYGSRKLVALDSVLVHRRKFLHLRRSARNIANENPRRPVIGRVPRDFDLDSPRGAEKIHALEVGRLRAAGEDRLPGRKLHHHGS